MTTTHVLQLALVWLGVLNPGWRNAALIFADRGCAAVVAVDIRGTPESPVLKWGFVLLTA
jgi:hypothetical protein